MDKYSSNINAEFDINFKLQYDENKQNLLIGLIISIPDIHILKM